MSNDKLKETFTIENIVKTAIVLLASSGVSLGTDALNENAKDQYINELETKVENAVTRIESLEEEKEILFNEIATKATKAENTRLLEAIIKDGERITKNSTKIQIYHHERD